MSEYVHDFFLGLKESHTGMGKWEQEQKGTVTLVTFVIIFFSKAMINDEFSTVMHQSHIFNFNECKGNECIFGSFTKLFYTAVAEYSLIAAAIMFIVWHNIGRLHNKKLSDSFEEECRFRWPKITRGKF